MNWVHGWSEGKKPLGAHSSQEVLPLCGEMLPFQLACPELCASIEADEAVGVLETLRFCTGSGVVKKRIAVAHLPPSQKPLRGHGSILISSRCNLRGCGQVFVSREDGNHDHDIPWLQEVLHPAKRQGGLLLSCE